MLNVQTLPDYYARPETPACIVMDSNALIAEDLRGSLMASGLCRVIVVTQPDQLLRVLDSERRVHAAFLEMRFNQVLEAGIEEALKARGARIVLTMGEDDEINVIRRGWAMLVRPFTEDMIRATIS